MSETDEFGRRIAAALDKLEAGLEKLGQPAEPVPDQAMLDALEEERTANAQLQERIRVLKEKSEPEPKENSEAEVGELHQKLAAYEARFAELEAELQRVHHANQELSEACLALRDANSDGVGDADLINAAMQAELEALRAARAADIAESSAILSQLQPLIEAARSDTKGEGA